MEHSESINELIAALAKAQAGIKPPQKVHTATVKTKTGGTYAYTYTGLAEAIDATRIPLSENGLVLMQIPHDAQGDCVVESVIAHSSGQWLSGTLRITPIDTSPQGFGSCLTYCRRYSALMVLGLAPEDDDGALGNGGEHTNPPSPESKVPYASTSQAPPTQSEGACTEKPTVNEDALKKTLHNDIVKELKKQKLSVPHWLKTHYMGNGLPTDQTVDMLRELLADLEKTADRREFSKDTSEVPFE